MTPDELRKVEGCGEQPHSILFHAKAHWFFGNCDRCAQRIIDAVVKDFIWHVRQDFSNAMKEATGKIEKPSTGKPSTDGTPYMKG